MTEFTKKCFCKKTEEKFVSGKDFGANVITQFFCPDCSNRAPDDAILFEVEDVPGKLGVYGIDWNIAEMKRTDPEFRDEVEYYENLLMNGDVTLADLHKEEKTPVVWGRKSEDEFSGTLGGKDYFDDGDESPSKSPKKARSGAGRDF